MCYFCVIITGTGRVITTSAVDTMEQAMLSSETYRDYALIVHIVRDKRGCAEIVYTAGTSIT